MNSTDCRCSGEIATTAGTGADVGKEGTAESSLETMVGRRLGHRARAQTRESRAVLWSLKRRNDDHKTAADARAGAWAGVVS